MKKFFILLVLFILFPIITFASTIEVSWNANSESDIAGYRIYVGNSSGNYPTVIDVGNVLIFDITNAIETSTYYIAVTAYNTSSLESEKSDEIFITVPDATSPSSITINIQIQ